MPYLRKQIPSFPSKTKIPWGGLRFEARKQQSFNIPPRSQNRKKGWRVGCFVFLRNKIEISCNVG